MAGEAGIEPTSSVLETEVMPLYDSPSEIVLRSRLTQMIKMRRLREGAPFNVPEERSTFSTQHSSIGSVRNSWRKKLVGVVGFEPTLYWF